MRVLLSLCIALLLAEAANTQAQPVEFDAQSSGVILQYHHIDADMPPVTSTNPEIFKAQMDYLAKNQFAIWPLDRLVDHVRAGKPTPNRTVAITFDDAYRSIYTTAFPILKKKKWPFAIFVSTETVGTNKDQFLNWEQLQELQKYGAIIANHTHTHTHLIRLNEGEALSEWRKRIRADIEKASVLIKLNTGSNAKLIAFPYGEYDRDVLSIIKDLGLTGFGQQSGALGMHDIFEVLPRFPMGGIYGDLETFKTKVDTLPLPIETVWIEPLVTNDLQPELPLTFLYEHPKLKQLSCYGPGGERTELQRVSTLKFIARSKTPIPVGRSRYNCTMPTVTGDRFFWFSQMWIRPNPDGSWYPEP